MVLNRRPKSKRVKVKDRETRKKKVKDGRKKNKKLAKKNPEWKSRLKKDPGMPNSFPYKDQIIAEAEIAKLDDAGERKRQSDLREQMKSGEIEQLSGISVIEQSSRPVAALISDIENVQEEEEETPLLRDPELPHLQAVLDRADVVVHVLDCRDPLGYRVPALEQAAIRAGCTLVFLLSKIDYVARDVASAWLTYLRRQQPAFAFRSASRYLPFKLSPESSGVTSPSPLEDSLGRDGFLEFIGSLPQTNPTTPFTVAFTGITNSGKSSIINSLIQENLLRHHRPRKTEEFGSQSTTLYPFAIEGKLEVKGRPIILLDSPGLQLVHPIGVSSDESESLQSLEMLLRRRGHFERVKNPIPAASQIVLRASPEELMVLYNSSVFKKGDVTSILTSLARASGRLGRRDSADLKSAAMMVLRDWRNGTFAGYTFPPADEALPGGSSAEAQALYKKYDSPILSHLPPLAELLSGERLRNIVRLEPGKPWIGTVDLTATYADPSTDVSESSEESEGEDVGVQDTFMGLDDESDGEDVEDTDSGSEASSDTPPSTVAKKRKAGEVAMDPRAKRVAFSVNVSSPATSKVSKTQQKARKQEAALARSQSIQSLPSSKLERPTPIEKSLKVANAPAGTGMKKRVIGAVTQDGSDMAYDFTAHFKGV